MLPTRLPRAAFAGLALFAIACGDPTKPKATYVSAESSYALYALTGAPANAPTAISFLGGSVRADANFAFDVALDLDANGRVIVYPVRVIGGGLAGASQATGVLARIGLQVVPGAFDALTEAPKIGYDTLTTQVVSPGAVLAVELLDYQTCIYSLGGQSMFAKLTIDSVDVAGRRVYARTVLDPNCGYRGLVADSLPRN